MSTPSNRVVSSVDVEKERLRFEGNLDKWMKIIGAGITGYQPEAYAVMDAACMELVKRRADEQGVMENPRKIYELFRKDRPYLPEWADLSRVEQARFAARCQSFTSVMQSLLGALYRHHKYPRNEHNTNRCSEVPLRSSRKPQSFTLNSDSEYRRR